MDLVGKTALVTGANSGIGRAIALALGNAGADVAVNYVVNGEAAEEVRRQIEGVGRRCIAVKADISQADQVASMVGRTVAELGRIDILVNNAGVQVRKPFVDLTMDDWDRMLSVDLHGAFFVTLYAVREMVKGGSGRIINITSVHQTVPKPEFAPYCVAKAGVGMLTQVLSSELAPYKINVNNIAPGAIETPMNKDLLENPDLLRKTIDEVPLGRLGRPEEVAAMAVYLASPEADYITGATFVIDGGLSQLGAKY